MKPSGASLSRGTGSVAVMTLLVTDLVDSTRLVEKLGDEKAAAVSMRHDRTARDLLTPLNGREIDKTDGFLLVFERPIDAVSYAVAYHRALADLSQELDLPLQARAGIHLGEVFLHESPPEDVARGAKPLEVEGLAKPTAARLMTLAGANQTLLTRGAFDLARRATVGGERPARDLRWLAHGSYVFVGLDEPVEVFEVGEVGVAPLAAPADSTKVRRAVPAGEEITLGWRPAPHMAIPQRPNWTLKERLAEGGFGEVWLAVQRKTGEKRAFKFCYQAEQLRALRREVTLFRLLKETLGDRGDIARILDWNFDEPPYFLETEYTEAGNLIEWVEEQGGLCELPLSTRLEIVAQVAEALAAAHSVGVLHKDVKPQNVLVALDHEGRPRIRLTDFGIGQVTDQRLLEDRGITVLGLTETSPTSGESAMTSGTHLYRAPELLEGKPATVQADIYALGVTLYQMVVGDFYHALAPGWRREVDDDLLVEDIASFVDGSPQRRTAHAQEVARRLRHLEERRARREAERRQRRAFERAQRRRKVSALVSAVSFVVLAVVSALALQAVRARQEADRRREQAESLISFMLGDLRKKLVPLGRLDILEDVGDKAHEYFASVSEDNLSAEELLQRAQALRQIGQVRMDQGEPAAALKAFQQALNLAQELVSRDPDNVAWQESLGFAHFRVGSVLWAQGDLDGALERFRIQRDVFERLAQADPEDLDKQMNVAFAHTNVGRVLESRGDLTEALEAYETVLAINERRARDAPSDDARWELGFAHNNVGKVMEALGELEAAFRHFLADLEIKQSLYDHDPLNADRQEALANSHAFMGWLLIRKDDLQGAQEHCRTAVRLAESLVARDDSNMSRRYQLAMHHRALGRALRLSGKTHEALDQFANSKQLLSGVVDKDTTRTAWQRALSVAHMETARTLVLSGQLSQAHAEAQEANKLLRQLLDKSADDRQSRFRLGESHLLLGLVSSRSGAEAEARSHWNRALELIQPVPRSSTDPERLAAWTLLLLHTGRLEEARSFVERLKELGCHDGELLDFYEDLPISARGRSL